MYASLPFKINTIPIKDGGKTIKEEQGEIKFNEHVYIMHACMSICEKRVHACMHKQLYMLVNSEKMRVIIYIYI